MMIKRSIIIILSLLLLNCCKNNSFNIKLNEKYEYDEINNLIKMIYKKSIENDIEYFKDKVNKFDVYYNDGSVEEIMEYNNILRNLNQRENYTNEEIQESKQLMTEIIKADIVKNYKKRAYFSNKGINFDYHWDEKKIHFQMFIRKNNDDEWELYSLWLCR